MILFEVEWVGSSITCMISFWSGFNSSDRIKKIFKKIVTGQNYDVGKKENDKYIFKSWQSFNGKCCDVNTNITLMLRYGKKTNADTGKS